MDIAMRSRLLVRVPVALWRVCGRAARRRSRSRAPARILMYHGTPRAEAAALERQLRYLASRFEIVPLTALASGERSGALALTFDDGLRSNVEVAYPILRRLGLPATFFVCPTLVDQGRWLWNHEARARLRRLGASAPEIESFVARMKRLGLAARGVVERRIEDETPDFRPTAEEHEAYDVAGWDELRALDPRIVAIGSHTLTHPILTTLTAQEAEAEIRESRAVLEKRLEREADLFCYPNGAVDSAALAAVRATYRIAVTTASGAVHRGADPLLLPRLAAPRGLLRTAWQIHP